MKEEEMFPKVLVFWRVEDTRSSKFILEGKEGPDLVAEKSGRDLNDYLRTVM